VITEGMESKKRIQSSLVQDLGGPHPQVRVEIPLRGEQPKERLVVRGLQGAKECPVIAVEAELSYIDGGRQQDDCYEKARVTPTSNSASELWGYPAR
jgi:hypothetical protein